MNEFVNYGKRSVSLPGGCKDLAEVLRLRRPTSEPVPLERCRLPEIESYILRQLQAAPKTSNLLILCGEAADNIQVALIDGVLNVFAIMNADTPREAAVRGVFEEAGVPLKGGEPLKTLAASTLVLRYELPNAAGPAAALICNLLRRGYGVSEKARLEFYYAEEDV